VVDTTLAADWVWWQAALPAVIGAVTGFVGARVSKWWDDRRTRASEEVKRVSDAVQEISVPVLDRLDALSRASDYERAVHEDEDLFSTAIGDRLRNVTYDFRNIADGSAVAAADSALAALDAAQDAWRRARDALVIQPRLRQAERDAEPENEFERRLVAVRDEYAEILQHDAYVIPLLLAASNLRSAVSSLTLEANIRRGTV
jgi:hypothetical protein